MSRYPVQWKSENLFSKHLPAGSRKRRNSLAAPLVLWYHLEKAGKEGDTMDRILTIGIAGGTGSGKTTITRRLQQEFENQVCTLYHDNYYRAHDDLPMEERQRLNYDEPAAFETDLLIAHLQALRSGRGVDSPLYDYTVHNRSAQTQHMEPSPVILVEGILILANEDLCRQMDIKVFVEADSDVRILRRIVRDVRERGRSLESVVNQYLTTVKPMHELYVEPSKHRADIIIPEGGYNEVAMELLIQRIHAHLQEA